MIIAYASPRTHRNKTSEYSHNYIFIVTQQLKFLLANFRLSPAILNGSLNLFLSGMAPFHASKGEYPYKLSWYCLLYLSIKAGKAPFKESQCITPIFCYCSFESCVPRRPRNNFL